jgi:hypothetical protein
VTSDNEDLEKAKFLYELALKSGEYVQKANERLNEKARWFTTSASTLVPLVLGVGYYILRQTTNSSIFFLFFVSLISLVSAIIIGMVIQRPTSLLVFDTQTFMNKFINKNQIFLIEKSTATWSDIFALNRDVINSKENYLYAVIGLICFSLLLLVIVFLTLGITMWN